MSNSTDLVGRLRAHVTDRGGASIDNGAWQMMLDAADEIESLTKERDTWDRRVAYDELKARETENRATQQKQIDEFAARALASESKLREIEAETFAKCARIVEVERLHDNTGHPEDAAYNMALKHAAAAIRSQASQGEKK